LDKPLVIYALIAMPAMGWDAADSTLVDKVTESVKGAKNWRSSHRPSGT
jgi:hypothetical protein